MLFLPKVEISFIEGDIPKGIDLGEDTHLDIETGGLDSDEHGLFVINIGYAPRADGTFGKALVCRVVDNKVCPPRMKKYLRDESVKKYIHNAMFDAPFIYKKWRVATLGVRCTKSLAKIVRKCAGNSYKRLTKKATDLDLLKGSTSVSEWSLPFSKWTSEMRNYCAYDVVFGFKIYKYLMHLATVEDKEVYERLSRIWPELVKLQDKLKLGDLRLI